MTQVDIGQVLDDHVKAADMINLSKKSSVENINICHHFLLVRLVVVVEDVVSSAPGGEESEYDPLKKDDHLVTTSIPSLVPAVPTCSSGVSYESSSVSRTHHYSSQSPGDLYGCRAYSSTGEE